MFNTDYFLYMAENEGVTSIVNTRQAALNAAIKDFQNYYRQGFNINDSEVQDKILNKHNLLNITDKEIDYISRKVSF